MAQACRGYAGKHGNDHGFRANMLSEHWRYFVEPLWLEAEHDEARSFANWIVLRV